MASEFSFQAVGLKEALKELNTMDKKLRRQVTKDFKQIMQPVIDDARPLIPNTAPLSGMARSWTSKSGAELMHWEADKVNKNLVAFTSGKKIRQTPMGFKQNVGVFGVIWTGPQATLFDVARNGNLGRKLTARYGIPSRVIWRAYLLNRNEVEDQVKELVKRVMNQVGRGGNL